jgi:hypothetical protein
LDGYGRMNFAYNAVFGCFTGIACGSVGLSYKIF